MKYILCVFLFCLTAIFGVRADDQDKEKIILIITSYNPDMRTMQINLEEFNRVFNEERGNIRARVFVESMDCLYLKDSSTWSDRLNAIMSKYDGAQSPDIVLLFGQEAWSTYLSQDNPRLKRIPIMPGMISRNTITLPSDSTDLATWNPESQDIRIDFHEFNVVGGYAYEYSLKNNIDLMRKMFPDVRNVVFLTDNTFGGVNMQAWIRKELSKYPDYDATFLDGRVLTADDVSRDLSALDAHTAVFCGTWRVDRTGEFVLGNAVSSLEAANSSIPVMTLSSVGLGSWAVGGFTPQYRTFGDEIAHECFAFLKDTSNISPITIIPGQYTFDYNRLRDFAIDAASVPETANIINQPVSLYDQHKTEIWTVVAIFVVLLLALLASRVQVARIKRLKKEVEDERNKVVEAMKQVEQASILKTRFIQNMSHEIRTPLNAIVGFAEVLSNSLDESLQTYADVITANSDDLLKMVNDIMVISGIDSGDNEKKKTVTLNSICNAAYSSAEFKKTENTDFRFRPANDSVTVLTSKNLVEAAVANMLHNAFKFTEKGFVEMKAEVSPDGNNAIITVTDNGPGIPHDKQEWVFERFTKINEFKQGAGIGLAICRAAAKEVGGTVKIDPDYVNGCRIIFTFPIE